MTTWDWKMSDWRSRQRSGFRGSHPLQFNAQGTTSATIIEKGRNQKRTAELEIFRNALGRCAENLVSGNGRAVAGGVARGIVNAGAHQSAGRTREHASPDSGQPKHPDTDYHLPQMWHDGACGGAPR